MSNAPQKKPRRLKAAPQTMRERAARESNKQPKPKRLSKVVTVFRPLKKLGKIGSLKIWKPFKAIGRFIGKFFVFRYLRQSSRELRQVEWPNRRQTFQLTSAVILFSLIFGIVVAVFDFGLDKLFKQVILR